MRKRILDEDDRKYLEGCADCKVSYTQAQQLSGEQKKTAQDNIGVTEAVEAALTEAKESGEFDGKDGKDGICDGIRAAMGTYTGNGTYLVADPDELATYPEGANILPLDFIPYTVDVYGERRCTFRIKDNGNYLYPTVEKNIRPFTPDVDGTIESAWGKPQVTTHFAYGVKPVISTWVTYDADNIYYAYRAEVPNAVFGSGLKAVVFIDKANDGVVGNRHGSDSEGDMIGWWVYANSGTGTGAWKDYAASWDGTYLKADGRQMGSKFKLVDGTYVFEGEYKIPRTSLPYVNAAIESGEAGRIPIRIGFYNNGTAYWSATKEEAARIPATGEVTYVTPTIDGAVEDSWGAPQSVTKSTGAATSPTISTWAACDDDNIYYAYRAEVKSVTFGTNLKAIVYIDKANDGSVGWSHGSGSTGDKIGWWYYPSVGNAGAWQDYSASWDGTYLKTAGRQLSSKVSVVNGVYVFEGELKITRASAPYISDALETDVEGKLPFRIEFMNGSSYVTDEEQAAKIPARPTMRELVYEANVVRDGATGVYPLAARLTYNKDGGTAYLVWSMSKDAISKGADLQLNKGDSAYSYVAFGVDVKTLYEKNGWKLEFDTDGRA